MLNRRFLRIKVFQALYALEQSDGENPAKFEREMLSGLGRVYDFYVHLLLVFGELRRHAENRIEERMAKRLPTKEDLDPDRRFVDSPLLVKLSQSPALLEQAEKRKAGWVGEHGLISALYKRIETSPEYQAYMKAETAGAKADRQLLIDLFVEHIAQSDSLYEHLETRSIHWLEELDLACALVKKTLAAMKEKGELKLEPLDDRLKEEREFVTMLYRDTVAHKAQDEELVAAHASNWKADRIALSDMLLMRMAITEARSFPLVPIKVTLNEYIEIAKAYSTPKSKNFINGILDKLFLEMKEQGAIHKVGRGLLEN